MINFIYQRIINWLLHEEKEVDTPLSDFNKICHEIKPTDLILIEGRSKISEIISTVTRSPWTHAAIYIGKYYDYRGTKYADLVNTNYSGALDEPLIVESMLGKGTIISKLSVYKGYHIRLCRPKDLAIQDQEKIIDFALSQVGNQYSLKEIFDLLRFFLPFKLLSRDLKAKLFSKKAGSNTKMVCSSMLASAFQSVQYPIMPMISNDKDRGVELIKRNPSLITPKDFDHSPYFEIIKYPIIAIGEKADYRQLPWRHY